MSTVFPIGPVLDATPEVQAITSRDEIKHAAIKKLHELHKNATVHHFDESVHGLHLLNWNVVKYAEEETPYGKNYFIKVHIGEGHHIHVRVHKQEHHDIYDFHSLHCNFKHNVESYIFNAEDPLEYFEQ